MSVPETGKPSPSVRKPASPNIEITRHDVSLPHLPEALRGMTIVQLSDFHKGCGGTDGLICEAIDLANELNPDFIALTGDFVNDHQADVLPIVKMVSGLRAKRGIYAVLGNHDHKSDAVLLASALDAAGIQVLNNRSVEVVPGLHFAGVDDMIEGEPDIQGTLSRVPKDEALVFLCHNPNGLDFVPSGMAPLVLSGHTHGAQFVLRFPSPLAICRFHLHTRYVHGWYERGAAKLYVNRGIGVTGMRLMAKRINCPPEITQVRLVPENR